MNERVEFQQTSGIPKTSLKAWFQTIYSLLTPRLDNVRKQSLRRDASYSDHDEACL